MNLDRIERALREGPVDEPRYQPGTHAERPNGRLLLVAATAVVAVALVMGVGIGIGMSILRGPSSIGSGVDLDRLGADLEGSWVSTELTVDDWVDGLLALGHDQDAIDFALGNLPPHERVRYRLTFVDDHVQIFASFDGAPFTGMSGGPYELLPNGSIYYDDIGCYMTIPVAIEEGRLRFEPMTTESCDADERLNNDAFFQLVEYERDPSE